MHVKILREVRGVARMIFRDKRNKEITYKRSILSDYTRLINFSNMLQLMLNFNFIRDASIDMQVSCNIEYHNSRITRSKQ